MARPRRGRGVRHASQRLAGWAATGLAAIAERLERLAGPRATPPEAPRADGPELPDAPAHWPEPWAAMLRERAPHLLEGGFLSYRTPPGVPQAGQRQPRGSPAPPRGDGTVAGSPRGVTGAGPSGPVRDGEASTGHGAAGAAGGRDELERGRAGLPEPAEPPPVVWPSRAGRRVGRTERAQRPAGHRDEAERRGRARQDPARAEGDTAGRPAAGAATGSQPEPAGGAAGQRPPPSPGPAAGDREPSPAGAPVAPAPDGAGPPARASEEATSKAQREHQGVPGGAAAFVPGSPGAAGVAGVVPATPPAPVAVTASPEPGGAAAPAPAPDLRFVAEHPATLEAALAWVAGAGRASTPATAAASFDPPRAPERLWPPLPQTATAFATRPEARPHAGEGAHLARLAREQEGR